MKLRNTASTQTVQTTNNTNTTEEFTMKLSTTTQNAVKIAAHKGFDFNFEAGTINNRVVRNFVIVQETKGKTLISAELKGRKGMMELVLGRTMGLSTSETNALVFKTLEQVLFVETTGYGNPEALSELPTDLQVANANKAYVVTPDLKSTSLHGNTVAVLLQNDSYTMIPDKKVGKFVLVGDGATAAGVYRDGDTLTSVNPLTDATKGLTRCNAGFAGKADSADRVVSALEFEAEGGNFVKEGIAHQALFVPGLAVLAQGMISVNETTSFDFNMTADFTRKFAVETVGTEVTEIVCPDFLAHGSEILVNGVVIYTHESFCEVEVHHHTAELNELGSVWTFSFNASKVAVNKTNVKARDFGKKGMTHRSGVEVEETQSWDLLYTSECVKTSETLRTMFTQANRGHLQGIDGVLRNAQGVEVTSADINAWYRANGQNFTVSVPVHESCVESLKLATGDVVTFSAPDEDGIVLATQIVFGIQSESLMNIEVSSSDEIAGFGRTDAIAATLQSMIKA